MIAHGYMARLAVFVMLVSGAAGCGCSKKPVAPEAVAGAAGAPAPVGAAAQAESAAFHLDLAAVYERHGHRAAAAEHFTRAGELARQPAQAVQAYAGLARLREAAGDHAGTVRALEQALAARQRHAEAVRDQGAGVAAGPAAGLAPELPVDADDLVRRLGRIYAGLGQYREAEALYERALREARDTYRRDHLLRLLVQLYRQQGTLDERVTEREQALAEASDGGAPDETALRFLAIAHGAGGPAMATFDLAVRPGAPASGPASAPAVSKLIPIYERLLRLHPSDAELRQGLLALYQQGGRVDDALALARHAPVAAAGGPAGPRPGGDEARCPGGLRSGPRAGGLSPTEEAVRVLLQAGRKDDALAEIGKLLAPGGGPGVERHLLAGRLFLMQDRRDLAERAVALGEKAARSAEERRELAGLRAETLARGGRQAELTRLYEQWARSADPCYRVEAARHQTQAHAAAGPLGPGAR